MNICSRSGGRFPWHLLSTLTFTCVAFCTVAVDFDPVLRGRWPLLPRGLAYAVAIQNGYAFVADEAAGLTVIDVRNPANPQTVGGYDTSGNAYGVAVSGNYAYVAEYVAGLEGSGGRHPAHPPLEGVHVHRRAAGLWPAGVAYLGYWAES